MMAVPESTSAEAFDRYVSGRLIAASKGWKDLLVRIYSEAPETVRLRDVSGFRDTFLAAVLDELRGEVSAGRPAGPLFVQGIAQALAVHLARNYTELTKDVQEYKGGLPGFKLRKITELMIAHLEEEFSLIRLAREADMSEFHFSRLFKRTTGLTPSQYFIRLRMEKARRLLRETTRERNRDRARCGLHQPEPFRANFPSRSWCSSKRISTDGLIPTSRCTFLRKTPTV
jgi:AraC family transcriptional regulator